MWGTLLNSASPTEFVGLFISTTAYRLTLKCHCYSSLALWETIKNTPLNPIYKLSARLCVRGKLHWVVQHIKTDWTASSDHVTQKISILSEVICKCLQWVNIYACGPISVWLHATQWEKIEAIIIFQFLQWPYLFHRYILVFYFFVISQDSEMASCCFHISCDLLRKIGKCVPHSTLNTKNLLTYYNFEWRLHNISSRLPTLR